MEEVDKNRQSINTINKRISKTQNDLDTVTCEILFLDKHKEYYIGIYYHKMRRDLINKRSSFIERIRALNRNIDFYQANNNVDGGRKD